MCFSAECRHYLTLDTGEEGFATDDPLPAEERLGCNLNPFMSSLQIPSKKNVIIASLKAFSGSLLSHNYSLALHSELQSHVMKR